MRILWINCRLLHPLNGGDRIRTYSMLKELKEAHHVTYLTFRTPSDADEAIDHATEYCNELRLVPHRDTTRKSLGKYAEIFSNSIAGGTPYLGTKYRSAQMTGIIRELDASGSIDLIICDYQAPMVNLLDLGKPPSTRIILFQHNVESVIYQRHLECAASPFSRWLYRRQHAMTVAYELASADFVDGEIAVSRDDALVFSEELGIDNVLGVVPTGVDFDYFQNPGVNREPHTMAFLGSMDWHANIDSVTWFTREIYPAIRHEVPDARFVIIGRNPDPSILALAEKDSSIEVTGTVDDVRPSLERASMLVLPLRVGGGTRIKVFEAMAMHLPVVSTSIGTEGLELTPGEHFVAAETAGDFANDSIRLLKSAELRNELATDAYDHIRLHYSWSQVTRKFEELCEAVDIAPPAD